MTDFVNTIDVIGDDVTLKALVEKTLTEFNDDVITKIGPYALFANQNLTRVNLPNVTVISTGAFQACKALPCIDLPNVNKIYRYAFFICSSLKTLIIRTTSVCSLVHKDAFDYSPFASNGTGGTVYVPQSLIESYQTATNWSSLYASGKCNFVAIEGSEYE